MLSMKQNQKRLSSARNYAFIIPSIATSRAMAVPITPPPSHPSFSSQTDPQYQNQNQQPLGFDDHKHSKSTTNPLDERFERRVEWMLDHFQVPGVSIAVVTGNDTFLNVNIYLSGDPCFLAFTEDYAHGFFSYQI